MKQVKLKEKMLCQLCGYHNEPIDIHLRGHKHKTSEKILLEFQECSPLKEATQGKRWTA